MTSRIEWTFDGKVWPVTRGCELESPGCLFCYAMRDGARFVKGYNAGYIELRERELRVSPTEKITKRLPVWTGKVSTLERNLTMPFGWRNPVSVFVNSTSDLFHPEVPGDFIGAVLGVIAVTREHKYMILTKRDEGLAHWFEQFLRAPYFGSVAKLLQETARKIEAAGLMTRAIRKRLDSAINLALRDLLRWPLDNLIVGVSAENQHYADRRIPNLLRVPGMRFVSIEPQLDAIDLRPYLFGGACAHCGQVRVRREQIELCMSCGTWVPCPESRELHWIIVGGESGIPGQTARPYHLAWAREIVRACRGARVPVFVKQLGRYPRVAETSEFLRAVGPSMSNVGLITMQDGEKPSLMLNHLRGGDMGEWPFDLRVRQSPRWPGDSDSRLERP